MNEIREHEVIAGALQPLGNGRYEITAAPGGRLAIELDPIDHTRPASLYVNVWHESGRYVDIAVQNTTDSGRGWLADPLNGGETRFRTTLTANLIHDLAVTIELNNVIVGDTFEIELTHDGPAPAGPRRLLFEAYLPNASLYHRLIGDLTLGVYRFPSETLYGSYFILGESRLNWSRLPGVADEYRWTNLTDPATRITVNRELEDTGVTLRATPATLSVEIYNALPPRAIGLIRGTPVRLYDTVTRLPVFTGLLDVPPTEITEATGEYRVTVNAVDLVGVLAQITRYQATAITTVNDALAELLDKTGLPWRLSATSSLPALNGVIREASLTEYLDMVAASFNGAWYVARDGVITFKQGGDAQRYYLTDQPDSSPLALHYVRGAIEYDPATAVSDLEITRYSTGLDDKGELESIETTILVTNEQTRKEYGQRTVSVDMATASDQTARTIGAAMLGAHEPRPTLSSVTFAPYDKYDGANHATELDALLSLELRDIMTATYRNQALTAISITGISHVITPSTWRTELKLRNERG